MKRDKRVLKYLEVKDALMRFCLYKTMFNRHLGARADHCRNPTYGKDVFTLYFPSALDYTGPLAWRWNHEMAVISIERFVFSWDCLRPREVQRHLAIAVLNKPSQSPFTKSRHVKTLVLDLSTEVPKSSCRNLSQCSSQRTTLDGWWSA